MAEKQLTPADLRNQNLMPLTESEQDLQALMVTPQDGRASISPQLNDMFVIKTQEGDRSKRSNLNVWHLLSVITSDSRLSNYTKAQEKYARFCTKMQGWCLDEGMAKPAATAHWMRTAVNETSLGREMALRNNLQEIRQKNESVLVESKPEKKTFLGL